MQNYDQAYLFIQSLTKQQPEEVVVNFRCINDRDKGVPAHLYTGTLLQHWETLCDYNSKGWGIFCNINAMDGQGNKLANVQYIRTHVIDLDNTLTSVPNYHRAAGSNPAPSFAVQTSPDKFHVYWSVEPYIGNDHYTMIQKKLRQVYDSDESVIDATRVLRVAGFYHCKGEPTLVTMWPLAGYGQRHSYQTMADSLAAVNIIDHGGTRSQLGDPDMSAPSLEWLQFAINMVDPNEMERDEWLLMGASIKQAGWLHTDEETLKQIWFNWCARYTAGNGNDIAENLKLWNSIHETKAGWGSIAKRSNAQAYMNFGFKDAPPEQPVLQPVQQQQTLQPANDFVNNVAQESYGEILSEYECKKWFHNCYFVQRTGQIFDKSGRFMKATQFNGAYGGKNFIITSTGKITDEAWKAALRSTCWTIPKVDHVRFLPDKPLFEITEDALRRKGLNTYIPTKIDARQGDVSLWLKHVELILPDRNDQRLFFEYLAHCVKYPGYKIPWAPLLQSAEGVGKTVFFEVLQHALGDMYVYSPKAPELVKSGSVFNAWMRGKLMIVVNEIKIDERRELIEILKPMITDARVEVQSKGVDQDMEDNPANWLFFSNYKDAIPISKNGRRYSIFYSVLQSSSDILQAGMDHEYFNRLWKWLREEGGLQAVAYWLLNYPIERGAIPVRAPETSSHEEALRVTRSPMESLVADHVQDGISGFRGGYVSSLAMLKACKAAGIRSPSQRAVQSCLEGMGYVELGRATRPYPQEDVTNRTIVYGLLSSLPLQGFAQAQGYSG